MNDFWHFYFLLIQYIVSKEGILLWLPIVGMVYSINEGGSLAQFWIGKVYLPRLQSLPRQYSQQLFAACRRRTISAILLGFLSGAFFMVLLCQRPSSQAGACAGHVKHMVMSCFIFHGLFG